MSPRRVSPYHQLYRSREWRAQESTVVDYGVWGGPASCLDTPDYPLLRVPESLPWSLSAHEPKVLAGDVGVLSEPQVSLVCLG